MRMSLMLAAIAVAGLTASSALAEEGVYSAPLSRMLTDAAEGSCTAELMAADLLTACQSQIANLAPALKALGPVQTVTLIKSETVPQGVFEAYRVTFADGQAVTWIIGGQVEGRFGTLYSAG